LLSGVPDTLDPVGSDQPLVTCARLVSQGFSSLPL
jgi:hypothetical protein